MESQAMSKNSHKVGGKYTTNEGYFIEIIEYFTSHNCTVQFEDGTTIFNKQYGDIKRGRISKPKNRIGEKSITNEGYEIEITEYFGCNNCTVKFNDGHVVKKVSYGVFLKGEVKNVFHPSVFNIGYFGEGVYNSTTHKKLYRAWQSMLTRCYDEKSRHIFPTYINCTVVSRWLSFQNFAHWHKENFKIYMEEWCLDKDILQKRNRIYSPETCCFVPREINLLFIKSDKVRGKYPIGVRKSGDFYQANMAKNGTEEYLGTFRDPKKAFECYKIEKEKYIKEVADKWRGKITEQVYEAMINYKVEIID